MNTWTLEYTVIDEEFDAEKTITLEGVSKLEGVPVILEQFIKEGVLLSFHLSLNVADSDDEDDWSYEEDDDEDWDGEEE